jgi:dihydroorotase
MLDLIIKNGQCYIDGDLKDVNVAVKDGKIHQIGEISEQAKEIIDAKGSNCFARLYRYSNSF